MSSERGFIPIPEVKTERLRANIRLPYRLEKQVGLNVNSIEMLAQIAGVSKIKIGMDTDRTAPQVVGFNSNGEAMAGLISNKNSAHSSENKIDGSDNNSGSKWSCLQINLNEQAAVSTMETYKVDIRDPRNWAVIIDDAIYKGILKSGFDNLMRRSPHEYFLSTISVSLIANDLLQANYFYAAESFALIKTVDTVLRTDMYGFEKNGEGHRWSLVYWGGPEIDRMLVLVAGLGINKLAKKID